MAFFWKITVKVSRGKTRSFWAKDRRRGNLTTTYMPVNNEGDDYSYYNKKRVLVIKKVMYSNDLIVKEQPAVEDRKYGTLRVVKG